ncbi:hypothetical protein R1sor_015722 [Riccia sorocarpa]|uniref:Uncharacterized protein n=1 Tax=Riccia sorocarpa TaxID=122646 RepID=A0ABD3HDD1_9MARC
MVGSSTEPTYRANLGARMCVETSPGFQTSDAHVIQFLFEEIEVTIAAVVQAAYPSSCPIPNTQLQRLRQRTLALALWKTPGDELPVELSVDEIAEEEPIIWNFTTKEFDDVIWRDSQAPRTLSNADLLVHPDATYRF